MIPSLLLAIGAFAQTPLSLTLPSLDDGVETLVVTADDARSKRWIDDPAPTHVVFAKDAVVRVLYREAGMVRVREGDRYGWLPASSLAKPDAPE